MASGDGGHPVLRVCQTHSQDGCQSRVHSQDAASPESDRKMAASPESEQMAGLRYGRLISSSEDIPLVSVQLAGLHKVPSLVVLSMESALPVMAAALLCVWVVRCTSNMAASESAKMAATCQRLHGSQLCLPRPVDQLCLPCLGYLLCPGLCQTSLQLRPGLGLQLC